MDIICYHAMGVMGLVHLPLSISRVWELALNLVMETMNWEPKGKIATKPPPGFLGSLRCS